MISEVTQGDCLEFMKSLPDKFFDLVIADPPYGIGQSGFIGTTYKETTVKNKKGFGNKKLYVKKDWDNCIPDSNYFAELNRVSKNQIIWGGNYFPLPLVKGWIFWHKKIANATTENFADGELAWTSFDRTARYFKYDWVGLGGINNGRESIHPTQKPVALYKWLLKNYAKEGDKIFDPMMGSQSSRIAAYDMGFSYWGVELDKDYFEAGCKRFEDFKSQLKLF